MQAHTPHQLTFEAANLPSGIYLIRAAGQTFVTTQTRDADEIAQRVMTSLTETPPTRHAAQAHSQLRRSKKPGTSSLRSIGKVCGGAPGAVAGTMRL